jgi:putative ABC transport system permease protein
LPDLLVGGAESAPQVRILTIALRNVLRNSRRSLVTMVVIGLAVTVLIFVRGLLNGVQENLKQSVAFGQTGVLQVHKRGYVDNVRRSPLSYGFTFDAALRDRIKRVEGVNEVAGRITFATMIASGDTTVFSLAFAVDPALEYEVCPRKARDIGKGAVVQAKKSVLSPEVRRQLAADVGTELTFMAPDKEGILNAALLDVGGVMNDNPAFSGDKKIAFVPLALAQELLRMDNEITELAVSSQELDTPEIVQARVQQAIGPAYEVHTWKQLSKFAVDALNNQEIAIGFVVFAFAALALFGILNTMLMIVLARTAEIGTMMAVGVRRRAILFMVMCEAAILGGLGALGGATLGFSAVLISGKIGIAIPRPGSSIPQLIQPTLGLRFAFGAIAVAALVSVLASIYPALRASRMTPTEALRS